MGPASEPPAPAELLAVTPPAPPLPAALDACDEPDEVVPTAPGDEQAATNTAESEARIARGRGMGPQYSHSRRAPPAPSIDSRRGSRVRIGVGLIVLIALIVAAYEFVPWPRAGHQPAGRQIPPQPVGAATIGQGDIRVLVNALGTVTPIAR